MNHEDQYYKKEIITLAVVFEISYKKDSPESREHAIKTAIKDVPYRLAGCGEHGCYGVERREVSLDKADVKCGHAALPKSSDGFLAVASSDLASSLLKP